MLNPCLRHIELSYYKSFMIDINKTQLKVMEIFSIPYLHISHLVYAGITMIIYIYIYRYIYAHMFIAIIWHKASCMQWIKNAFKIVVYVRKILVVRCDLSKYTRFYLRQQSKT